MGNSFSLKKTTLAHKEANDFVNAVVDAAITVDINDDGDIFFQYDPLAQLTAVKLNICKFYGDIDIEKVDDDVLYGMCCDIDIDALKKEIVIGQSDFNYIQLNDIIKASEMKIDYLKAQLVEQSVDRRSSVDKFVDELGRIIIPFLKKLTNIGEIDTDMINKFAERFANEDLDINAENIVNAVLQSKYNKTEETTTADADNVVSFESKYEEK